MKKTKKLSIEEVKHIAKLANLPVDNKQVSVLAEQFAVTIDFVNQLREVNIENIQPTSQVTGDANVFREDEIDQSRTLTQEQALSNAAKTYNGFFVVSRIID